MTKNIAVIRGDGIGPEIVNEALKVLDKVAELYGHTFSYTDVDMGGCAIDKYGDPLPESELKKCVESDSVLLGAVGGDKWNDVPGFMRPEKGLEVIKSKGCAVVQAHPFRDDCVVMKPGICHGIEVFNGHSTESRNDIALEWANKFGFIKTSGSDFHSGTPSGGIISDFLPDNEIELRDLILSGEFDLKTNEEI